MVDSAAKYKLCCPVRKIYFIGVNLATIKLTTKPKVITNATTVPKRCCARAVTASANGKTP